MNLNKCLIATVALILMSPNLFGQGCAQLKNEIERALKEGPRQKLGLLYKQLGDCLARERNENQAIEAYEKAIAYPFGSLDVNNRLEAALYLADHNSREIALSEVQKILINDPNNRQAYSLKQKLESMPQGGGQRVAPFIPLSEGESATSNQETNPDRKIERSERLATLYKKQGDYYAQNNKEPEAIKAYQKALSYSYDSLRPEERLSIAEYLGNIGNYPAAESEIEKVLKYEPHNPHALIIQARIYNWEGKLPAAERNADRILSNDPNHIEALLIKADILTRNNRARESIPIYHRVLQQPLDQKFSFQAHFGLAKAQIKLRDYKAAEIAMHNLKPKYPYQQRQKESIEIALRNAGTDKEQKIEQLPGKEKHEVLCAANLEKIARNQKDKNFAQLSHDYKELGDCYRDHEKREEAANAYEKAFSLPFGTLTLTDRIDMAEFLGHQDRYEIATLQLQKVLSNDPKNLRALIVIARILSWNEKYAEAEHNIDAALAMRPEKKEALLVKANILNWTNRSEQAVLIYRRLLDKELLLTPEEAFDVRYGLAEAYFNLENYGEGVRYLSELKVEFPYQKRKIARLMARLDKLKQRREERASVPPQESICTGENLRCRLRLAREYAACHHYDAAYGVLFPLLVCDACNPAVRISLGRILGLEGRYCEALGHLNFVLCQDPSNVDALITKGYILRWKGDIPGSTCAFNEALSIDRCNFDARVGKAWTYLARNWRPGAFELMVETPVCEEYQARDMIDLQRKVILGPIFNFRWFRYQDSDSIRVNDSIAEGTLYKCDWRLHVFYNHVHASQPVTTDFDAVVVEHADRVGVDLLKTFNPWFDIGGGVGYAHTDEGNFAIGSALANIRTHCGQYFIGSVYDIYTGTAAALFFKIRTWTNFIEYVYKITGRWGVGARYYYTKYSDANHSHKAQLAVEYLLIDTICWDLYVEYLTTLWDFKSQPVSPFVVPGVFGGNGYFDPQDYWGNQLGLTFYFENNCIEMRLHPYVGYATYRILGIHYNGVYYAGSASLDYFFSPRFSVGGAIEGGRYPLKNLKYNYSVLTARLMWAF